MDQRTREKEQVEAELANERSARAAVEKSVKEVEQKLKTLEDNFPALKEEWISKGINSCVEEVVQELAKEFQAGYDFALNKINLPINHELRVPVQMPKEEEIAEEETEEQVGEGEEEEEAAEGGTDKLQEGITADDSVYKEPLLKGPTNSEGQADQDNVPPTETKNTPLPPPEA